MFLVRHKVKELIEIIQDDQRLRDERKKAKKSRDKYKGVSSEEVSRKYDYSKFKNILPGLGCSRKDIYSPTEKIKALGKLGNIVAETFSFLSMFPCLPTPGNIVVETKFASWEAKMFPDKFRNIFVAETMFPSLPTCFQLEKHFS